MTDTGLGVPAEDAERIFDRFYRGRNSAAATGTALTAAAADIAPPAAAPHPAEPSP